MLLTAGRLISLMIMSQCFIFRIHMESFTNLPQREHEVFNKMYVLDENQLIIALKI